MANAFISPGDRLKVQDFARAECDGIAEPVFNNCGEDLELDLSHDPDLDLVRVLSPFQIKRRIFCFQLFQILHNKERIPVRRTGDLEAEVDVGNEV